MKRKEYIKVNKQKNNYLKENYILVEYKKDKVNKCLVFDLKNCIDYLQNEKNINLSENILLSKDFLKYHVKNERILFL